MSIIAKLSTPFQIPPEGVYAAQLVGVFDEGVQANPFKPGQNRHKAKLIWRVSLPDGSTTDLYDWVTLSLHDRSKLLKVVRALSGGNPVTDVDLETLVGRSCRLVIEHYVDLKGQKRTRVTGYHIVLEDSHFDPRDFDRGDQS